MQSLTQITGIISFLAGIGCMIWFLICLIRKKPKKKSLYGVGVCVAVFFLSFVVSMATMTPEERAAMDQRIQEKRELEAQQKAEKAAQKAADEAIRAKKAADEKEAKEAAKAAEEAAKEAERAQKEAEQIKKESEGGGVVGFFKGLFASKDSKESENKDEAKKTSSDDSKVKNKPNYALLSKEQIEKRMGVYITDFHIMKYSEAERMNGDIDTQGVIEINSNPQEHKFWAKFRDEKMVRLKIDSEIIFDETN